MRTLSPRGEQERGPCRVFLLLVSYLLQVQSPFPVLQWAHRQEFDLQKQAPLGAAAFSCGVGSAFCGGGVQPIAITTAASTIRSLVTVAS